MRFQRGAILVETAITVGLVLMLIVFSIQIGLVGFMQQTADAASFVYARGSVLGVNDPGGAAVAMNKIFPQIPVTATTSSPGPAPTPLVPVNYGYNDPNPLVAAASANNRHGGVSMLQNQTTNVTVTKPSIANMSGKSVGIKSISTEARARECGQHFNIAGSSAQCGAVGAPANYDIDFLTQGENTAPYYMGFNYMWHCTDHQPWTSTFCSSNSSVQIDALGVAEAEYYHTISDPNTCVTADNTACNGNENINQPGTDGFAGYLEGSYEPQACIQRNLDWMAGFFTQFPSLGDVYRQFYVPGTLPLNNYFFQAETNPASATYNPAFQGLYFYWHAAVDTSRPQYNGFAAGWNRLDNTTEKALTYITIRDRDGLQTGYPSSSYSPPGIYQYANRNGCNQHPAFTGYPTY